MSITQTDPSLALQGAMVTALKANADLDALGLGDRVFDRVEPGAVFPYIKVGEDVVAPLDRDCGSDTELFSTVRVFSRKPGRVECKRFAEVLRFALTKQADFTVPGYRVVIGYCEGYRIEEHTDGLTHQAIVDFRFRLLPVTP